jgi:hypothetical protein
MSRLIRKVLTVDDDVNQEDQSESGNGSYSLPEYPVADGLASEHKVQYQFVTLRIEGSYEQLSRYPERYFEGSVQGLEDADGEKIGTEMSIVLLGVSVIRVSGTGLGVDCELSVAGTDVPVMIHANGSLSTDQQRQQQAPGDADTPAARTHVDMMLRYHCDQELNAGSAYGYTYNHLHKHAKPQKDANAVLVPINYQYYPVLRVVTRRQLEEKHGPYGRSLVEAAMLRKNDEYWKVEFEQLKSTSKEVEGKLAGAFKPIKLDKLCWKLARFVAAPWESELPPHFDISYRKELEIQLSFCYIVAQN